MGRVEALFVHVCDCEADGIRGRECGSAENESIRRRGRFSAALRWRLCGGCFRLAGGVGLCLDRIE